MSPLPYLLGVVSGSKEQLLVAPSEVIRKRWAEPLGTSNLTKSGVGAAAMSMGSYRQDG